MGCSGLIMEKTFRRIMLRTIDLDGTLCAAAIEIDDVSVKLLLTAELIGMTAQKVVPKFVFLRRGFTAQFLRF